LQELEHKVACVTVTDEENPTAIVLANERIAQLGE
jgi:hypothetical protein